MKNILILLSFYLPSAFTATIKIIGPCSKTPIRESQLEIKNFSKNLGQITLDYLAQENIPYEGDQSGIRSINHSAVGDDALEILSDTKMRAYGWCVAVNNINVEKMPDEIFLTKQNDIVTWYYAYATYDHGEWVNFCSPSFLLMPSIFCSQK
jgi:hypothetical protein